MHELSPNIVNHIHNKAKEVTGYHAEIAKFRKQIL